jgi:predicted nucleotidyltransferase
MNGSEHAATPDRPAPGSTSGPGQKLHLRAALKALTDAPADPAAGAHLGALAEALRRALAAFDPAVIYLFGSALRGLPRPDSDLDVAFLPPAPCDAWAVFQAAQDLAARLGCEVDLVDLQRASTVLRKEVLRTGRRLVTRRPRAADEFEMYTLSDYARLNEERAPVLRALGEPLSTRG